jgi:hypothetical protein
MWDDDGGKPMPKAGQGMQVWKLWLQIGVQEKPQK